MTDYEKEYKRCIKACGDPFEVFVQFFEAADAGLAVLDVGCGQGRDALMAARMGHTVVGIDISPTGIDQMLATAKREGLSITAEVADLREYDTSSMFDVVVLDRVLHMLSDDHQKLELLGKAAGWTTSGGHVLVADTKSNRITIRGFFEDARWQVVLRRGDYLVVRNVN